MSFTYTPTKDDIINVIQLLHDNGISITNAKAAYEQLKQYESSPHFCILLAIVFSSSECPDPSIPLPVDWQRYRLLAGLTLKNNIIAARHALGEEAVTECGRRALDTLINAPNVSIARVSSQIVVKITQMTSLAWWPHQVGKDLAVLLLQELLPAGGNRTLAAVYSLQYIMEDIPDEVGEASEQIIDAVSQVAKDSKVPLTLRKAGFRMCCNAYERASLLEWNVDTLSPLQQGLVNGSLSFAYTCTVLLESSCDGDIAYLTDVLRSCWFLLDYFDYFSSPLTADDQKKFQDVWVIFTSKLICGYMQEPKITSDKSVLVAAAIDVLSGILDKFEASGGETALAFLSEPLSSPELIQHLLPTLIRGSYLSAEEIQDIMETDDTAHRSLYAVLCQLNDLQGKDIAEDEALEDHVAAISLRSSSIKCIESLCQHEFDVVTGFLMPQIETVWASNDWLAREVGFVLFGTMASRFTGQETFFPSVLQHVLQTIESQGEHPCLVSMALWALSRLLECVFGLDANKFAFMFDTFGSLLSSRSKRVQEGCISGLMRAITVVTTYTGASVNPKINEAFERLIPRLLHCFGEYHTKSLALLVQFVVRFVPLIIYSPQLTSLLSVSVHQRKLRWASFEASYYAMYVQEDIKTTMLDMDVFSFDRLIIVLLSYSPDEEFAHECLYACTSLLNDIVQRGITDNADLVFNVLLTAAGYIKCITSNHFQAHVVPLAEPLFTAASHFWRTTDQKMVKVASISLLGLLIRGLRVANIPVPSCEMVHEILVQTLGEEENFQLKQHLFSLGMELVRAHSSHPASLKTYIALDGVLRSDVFGDSLQYFVEMATMECKCLVDNVKQFLSVTRLEVIVQLLAQAPNDFLKSDCTIAVCTVLSHLSPLLMQQLLPDLLRLVYSWQQAAADYPGTLEALRGLLMLLMQDCGSALQEALTAIPPSLRGFVGATYSISL